MEIRLKEKYVWGKVRTYPDCKISQAIVDLLPKDCSNKKPVTLTEEQIKILESIGFKVYIERAIISPDTLKRRARHLSRELNRKLKNKPIK